MDDLYCIQCTKTLNVKIGRSKHVETRLKQLSTGSPYPLRIVLVLKGKGYMERQLHDRMRKYRTQGEWFGLDGLAELPSWIYEQFDLDLMGSRS